MENEFDQPTENQNTDASNEHQIIGGPGKLRGKDNPKPFTSTYQPGIQKSIETRKKQKEMRQALKKLLNSKYTFDDDSRIKQQLEKAFGKAVVKKFTAGEIMALQQMQKAIKQADTQAFTAVMNQALGMPKQQIEDPNKQDHPAVLLQLPPGVSISFPSNTDGE